MLYKLRCILYSCFSFIIIRLVVSVVFKVQISRSHISLCVLAFASIYYLLYIYKYLADWWKVSHNNPEQRLRRVQFIEVVLSSFADTAGKKCWHCSRKAWDRRRHSPGFRHYSRSSLFRLWHSFLRQMRRSVSLFIFFVFLI